MNSEEKSLLELNALIREIKDSFIEVPAGSRGLPYWATYSYPYIDGRTGGEIFFEMISGQGKEYYLTNAEIEALTNNKDLFLENIKENEPIDLIEFGAGNPSKAFILIDHLFNKTSDVSYYAIDIDSIGLKYLKEEVYKKYPDLQVNTIEADFNLGLNFLQQKEINKNKRKKIALLFGSTIGNFNGVFRDHFLFKLKTSLNKNDLAIIGFDLLKDSKIMEDAYNKSNGLPEALSRNLLHRLNNQCEGNFNLEDFDYKSFFIEEPGRVAAIKSYLISKKRQEIKILGEQLILEEGEKIHTLDSYKFTDKDLDSIAKTAGFKIVQKLYDKKNWYVNVIFKA